MGLCFNMLLRDAGVDPEDVRLLRHQTHLDPGRTPYSRWRDDERDFEEYQRRQNGSAQMRARFAGGYWASFVAPAPGATMFVGLYTARLVGPWPGAPEHDEYDCQRLEALSEYRGRLFVNWGDTSSAKRAWVQRADRQDKPIVELRLKYEVERFPGFAHFIRPLSEIEAMPAEWRAILTANRGVYVLTCPRTREQYVGSACGADGFLGRWLQYASTGHGGNVALRSSEPSDYVVSILEVAGSAADDNDVLAMEALWKRRLLSREIGLNRN